MKIPFYYILLMLPILIQAQGGPLTLNTPEGGAVSFLTQNGNYADLDAEGSEYFDETYRMGEVTIRDKVELRGKMRFNAFRNEIQVLQEGDESFPLLKRSYIKAAIGKKVFGIYLYEDAKGNNRSSYFNPLNEGNTILLYKPEIKLKKGRVPATSYDRTVPPTFIDVSTYYIKKGDKTAKRIRLKKTDILAILSDKKNEIQAYIKSENLSLKKEDDLIKLMDYYNSI
jgi:hypothetical protein